MPHDKLKELAALCGGIALLVATSLLLSAYPIKNAKNIAAVTDYENSSVSISANPQVVGSGGSSVISYSASIVDPNSCVVTGPSGTLYSAQGWAKTSAPSGNWESITSSADGSKLAAIIYGGGLYISTTTGTTWMKTSAPSGNWEGITSSSDGTKLAAVMLSVGIYTSTNSGTTWTKTSAPANRWFKIASSADGSKLAAVTDCTSSSCNSDGYIWTSTDGGTTWTQQAFHNYWTNITSSQDGTVLAATAFSGGVFPGGNYVSSDGGSNWSYAGWMNDYSSSISDSYDIAMDSVGHDMIATDNDTGYLATSTNGGITSWAYANAPSSYNWRTVTSSADGTKLAAGIYGGGIYLSGNGGSTWAKSNAPSANWSAMVASQDGSKLAAAVYGGGIYVEQSDYGNLNGTYTANNITSQQVYTISCTSGGVAVAASTTVAIAGAPQLTITGNGANPASGVVSSPITVAATFTAGSNDALQETAINDNNNNLWCGTGNTCDDSMWTAQPLGSKSYTFTPTTTGTYTFYPAVQTTAYPSWNNYGKSLVIQVQAACPNGQGAAGSCTSCNAGYVLIGTAPNNQCVAQCPNGQGAAGSCTSCNSGYVLSGGNCLAQCSNGQGTAGSCTSCNSGYILQGGNCVLNSPSLISFSPTPTRVQKGSSVRLTWTGSNLPSSCTLSSSPAISGLPESVPSNAAGGSVSGIGPINQITKFTLTCGSASVSTNVSLVPAYQEI